MTTAKDKAAGLFYEEFTNPSLPVDVAIELAVLLLDDAIDRGGEVSVGQQERLIDMLDLYYQGPEQ